MSDVAVAAPAPVPARQRNLTLDGLKYVCAALIVLHHVSAIDGGYKHGAFLEDAAVTALYAFFAISGYLHGAVGGRGNSWRWQRFVRLGIPYAFWSCIYLVYDQLPGVQRGFPNVFFLIFAAGAHGILWFLPALLACALLADVAVRNATLRRIAIALMAVLTVLEVGLRIDQRFFSPWIVVRFPYWFLIYLAGMEIRSWKKLKPSALDTILFGGLALGVMAEVGYVNVKFTMFGGRMLTAVEMTLWAVGALLLVFGAVNELWPLMPKLAWGRDYLIGVYLSHVLWLAAWLALVPPAGVNPDLWIAGGWAFCFGGASALTWLLLRFKLTRPVVL